VRDNIVVQVGHVSVLIGGAREAQGTGVKAGPVLLPALLFMSGRTRYMPLP
jgi:hypothetical protein